MPVSITLASAVDTGLLAALIATIIAVLKPAITHPRAMTSAEKLHLASAVAGAVLLPLVEMATPGFKAVYGSIFTAVEQGFILGAGTTIAYAGVKSISLPSINLSAPASSVASATPTGVMASSNASATPTDVMASSVSTK